MRFARVFDPETGEMTIIKHTGPDAFEVEAKLGTVSFDKVDRIVRALNAQEGKD